MRKKLGFFLACTALCLSFSACSCAEPISLADSEASDGESLRNEVSRDHAKESENTYQVRDSRKNAVSGSQSLNLSDDLKSGQNESSDPALGYGYIADADGNVIEYVPAIDITTVSSEVVSDVDLSETDIILDSLISARTMPVDKIEYGTYHLLDNGLEALIGEKYVNIFVESEIGTDIPALESGTVTEVGFGSGLGYYVCIESCDGRLIKYAHLSEIKAEEGDAAEKGQAIGCAGITGAVSESGTSYILYES